MGLRAADHSSGPTKHLEDRSKLFATVNLTNGCSRSLPVPDPVEGSACSRLGALRAYPFPCLLILLCARETTTRGLDTLQLVPPLDCLVYLVKAKVSCLVGYFFLVEFLLLWAWIALKVQLSVVWRLTCLLDSIQRWTG